MIILIICTLFLVYILLNCADIYLYKKNKAIHGGENNKLRWYYHLRKYSIDIPPAHLSTYHLQVHDTDYKSLPYFGTIDDPVIAQIAEDFNDLFKFKSDKFKAHCLQAMIQQNVAYVSDNVRFGIDNCWCFPIRTLITKHGDCEDSALLYAGLAHLIGIDVVLVYFETHMLCAVFVSGDDYIPIELTGYIPLPSSSKKLVGGKMIYLCYPTEEFRERIQRY